jgi:hypothetical protein
MMIQSKRSIVSSAGAGLDGPSKSRLLSLIVLLIIFLSPGCSKDPEADATAELAASFEGSPAKEDVVNANVAFEERRYKDSLKLIHAAVGRGTLAQVTMSTQNAYIADPRGQNHPLIADQS